jgi:leader peptidase (prepilin peptidase)/N-methyltransferase
VDLLVAAFAGSPALLVGAVLLLGLLVGSFLNVVIHRVPIMLDREWRAECERLALEAQPQAQGQVQAPAAGAEPYNLVVPRSACPACRAPITALQNIPVVSWLALRGKCANCGTGISARYPLVELLTGLMSAAVAWKFGFGWPMLAALVLTWYLVALTFIDLDTQLLPDSLTLPLLWIGLVLSLWAADAGGAAVPVEPRTALIGASAGYLSLWSVYWLFKLTTGKEGMGYGDFKLLAALGAWLGWKMILPIVLCSALVGAVVGGALMLRLGRDRSVPIAFGPYLAAAGWLMLMWGDEIVDRYLGLFRTAS